MSFKQKVVLITGGSSDLGAITAKLFAKECAAVVIVGQDEAKLKAVAKCLTTLGAETLVINADASKDKEACIIIKTTVSKFGRLDVLVNNAGISKNAGILTEHFLETYDEVMNINMRGAVLITYYAAPYLIKTKGNIINVAGIAGISNTPLNIAYKTAKAAMNHFTRNAALELAPYEVRVNTVSPGPVRASVFDGMDINIEKMLNNATLQRLSEPTDIAAIILYVASEKGKGITGSNFWRKLRLHNNTIDRNSYCKQFLGFRKL